MFRKRGFSVLELILSMMLFSVIASVSFFALQKVSQIWRRTLSRDNATAEMMKAHQAIQNDLLMGHIGVVTQPVPPSLGAGYDSDAIEFLTPLNLTTTLQPGADNKLVQEANGTSYMMYNLIYYAVVPANHDALYGSTCTGGNEGGYDYNCPHKVLLRQIQDQNPANDPTAPATADILINPWNTFLTRPTGFPRSPNLNTMAINLLSFRVTITGGEVLFDIQSVALDDAQKEVGIGNHSFRGSSFTLEEKFSVFPKN